MKRMIIIIISLLITFAYGDEANRRFLVENQDLPEAVKISYLSDQKGFNQYFAETYLWAKKDSL
ncbi:MAG TPA: hypothetical protein PK816_06710 [Candidatus Cloacimonadota bacterium]|nr:hypothetical protein [Candidatus Cloacimonadota bacterium]